MSAVDRLAAEKVGRDDWLSLPDGCLCDTSEEGWRPCPESLCERSDHDHEGDPE